MSRSDRIFRRLLRLFPAEFRGDFGDDMAQTFREHRDDTLARGGTMAYLRLWWDTLAGIATTAPREHLDLFRQDVRYGVRSLARSPGFAAVAILALAVGIGANTAVFSLVNGVLIQSLPYARPSELVLLFERVPGTPFEKFDFSAPDFEIVRGTTRSYSGMAAYRNATYELSGVAEPVRIHGARISPEVFDVLGVAPALGRAITADDDRLDAPVAVLSAGLWSRAFGRDPAILSKTITLDRHPYTVIGVMPDSFEFPLRGPASNGDPADVYVPIAFSPFERQGFGSMYNNTVVARLEPGVSAAQARGELAGVARQLAEQYPAALREMASKLELPLVPFGEEVVGGSRRLLIVLMAAVGIVLLIGCADVANLMLTRAGARQRELAIRSALGASPARVVRQLLTEGTVLATAGAACGLLLAYWSMRMILELAGDTLPRLDAVRFDGRVLAFTLVLAFVTPLLFATAPAMRAAVGQAADALKEGARATAGHSRHRLLASLVIVQFALALMLSVGAGLLVRSFMRLLDTNPGFRADHVVMTATTLPSGRYATGPQVKAFYREVVERARQIAGVTAAGAGNDLPLNVLERRTFSPDASAVQGDTVSRLVANTWTVGSYFEALGIPLKRGRFFGDDDGRGGQRVVIINETLANTFWPGQDPVGRQIKWGVMSSPAPWMTIVGVVGDVKQATIETPTIAQTYEPILQISDAAAGDTITGIFRTVNLVVRGQQSEEALLGVVRGELKRMDPALPVSRAEPLTAVVDQSVRPHRFSMTVVALFALVALALAGIGIYGVLANAVAQQTHEIGVRMALGATAGDVMWMVLRRALTLMAGGVAIGVAASFALTRLMAGLLYEVRPTDGATFLASAVILAALAAAAGLVPAWRATRVDPLVALRTE